MLRTPAFLGFSMSCRNNRRVLVAVTYMTALALMAALVIAPLRDRFAVVQLCFILAYSVISRVVFGRLVKDTVLPDLRGGQITSLDLASRRHHDEDEPDEREVAIRNAAHFAAYRPLAVYSIVLCLILPIFFQFNSSTALRLLQLVSMPMLTMALTLPQAVVLWTEPDVPEEARV